MRKWINLVYHSNQHSILRRMIPFWSPKSEFHFSVASFLRRPEIFCHYRDFLTMIFVFGSSRSICSTPSLVTGRLRCMRYWALKVLKTGFWRPRVRSPPGSNIFALFKKVQEWLKSPSRVFLLMFHALLGHCEPFGHSETDSRGAIISTHVRPLGHSDLTQIAWKL